MFGRMRSSFRYTEVSLLLERKILFVISGYPNKGPLFVGNAVADVTDKEENSFCDIEL